RKSGVKRRKVRRKEGLVVITFLWLKSICKTREEKKERKPKSSPPRHKGSYYFIYHSSFLPRKPQFHSSSPPPPPPSINSIQFNSIRNFFIQISTASRKENKSCWILVAELRSLSALPFVGRSKGSVAALS
ncbi:hypothetical protein IGI04_016413, partial [Brassica rapa subsp. trilocularis]